MAKRFTDTALNRQPWFRKLAPKLKCAIRFLFDECDNCGVWIIDMETLSYFVGEDVTIEELFFKVNSDKQNRIEIFKSDKIFIPGFIDFQYGTLSEKCMPHKPVIEKLKKYGLYERVLKGYQKGIETLEEKEKEQDKEKEEDFGKSENLLPFPDEKHLNLELPEIKIGACIELFRISKGIDASKEKILGFWAVFKNQNFTGKKYYSDVGDIHSHFINWLKNQNISNGTNKTSRERQNAASAAVSNDLKKAIEFINRGKTDNSDEIRA